MNSGVPSTEVACEFFIVVLRPKSPILISPLLELMNTLSHLISRWIMGVSCSCRYCNPLRIAQAHVFMTLSRGCFMRLRYRLREPPVTN